MIGESEPGGFMSLNGYHQEFYDRGGNSFIDEEKVMFVNVYNFEGCSKSFEAGRFRNIKSSMNIIIRRRSPHSS